MKNNFQQRADAIIRNQGLVADGQKILLGVSGGADSMALLHVFQRLAPAWGVKLGVAHYNHQLRGMESDLDEDLAGDKARELNLPFYNGRGKVAAMAARAKISVEMAARRLRHEFLAGVANREGYGVLALAHHADDQVELFFLRLLRGAGGTGLAGMKWKSPSPADPRLLLIRPFLGFSRREIHGYVKAEKILHREDSSNALEDALRNRVRNHLLPLLRRRYQPGLDAAVLRSMEIIQGESRVVSNAAQAWLKQKESRPGTKPVQSFQELDPAIQRQILRDELTALGQAPEFLVVEKLRESPETWVNLQNGQRVRRTREGVLQKEILTPLAFRSDKVRLELGEGEGEGRVHFGKRVFDWRVQAKGIESIPLLSGPKTAFPKEEFFDAQAVGSAVILRHWRPGDRFQPIGMDRAVKLQDLFVNAKIAAAERRQKVVATNGRGMIFWVEGLRIGERFKVTAQTQRCLVLKIPPLPQ